jgi:hypothetical protein
MSIHTTPEDHELVRSQLLLTLALTVFERDKSAITSALKTPGPYVDAIDRAMDEVSAELKRTRAAMRKRGVKVYEETRSDKDVKVRFLCRGYHDNITMLWSYVGAEVGKLMRKYLGVQRS